MMRVYYVQTTDKVRRTVVIAPPVGVAPHAPKREESVA